MKLEHRFAPEAEEDLDGAYHWYENQRAGLGGQFLQSVQECLDGFCSMPTMYEKVRGNIRRALLKRFPYAVFYEPVEDRIVIYSVMHTARHPDTWRRRRR